MTDEDRTYVKLLGFMSHKKEYPFRCMRFWYLTHGGENGAVIIEEEQPSGKWKTVYEIETLVRPAP